MAHANFKRLRFAPSPNGYLHLGHAYSALLNQQVATQLDAELLLRMEDIDETRARAEYVAAIYEDLKWLGLSWPKPVMQQSQRFEAYHAKLEWLNEQELVYRAFLSRKQIREFAAKHKQDFGHDWSSDPDGAPLYPDLCKQQSRTLSDRRADDGEPFTWRLDMPKAISYINHDLTWLEYDLDFTKSVIKADPSVWGDVIIARKDTPTSYHLSVVLDDAAQNIDLVVRGMDLYHASSVHRLLQVLFDLPEPGYIHHKLILGEDGRKLSKSNHDTSIRSLRDDEGQTLSQVKQMLGF
ncbi:MAG: tRNA glutamyl-Q(34) synthetase GluQRS [Lentilitoribacter sp.]